MKRTALTSTSRLGRGFSLLLPIVVLVAAFAGCEERLRPGFPHAMHLATKQCGGPDEAACPTCATCHQNWQVKNTPHLPTAEDCQRCHGAGTQKALAAVQSASQRRTPIVFPHERHLPLPKIAGGCVKCHRGVSQDGVAGQMYPPMAKCFECHENAFETGVCGPCHKRTDLAKLKPETFLRHDFVLFRDHREEAVRYQRTCNQCHTQETCDSCHDDMRTMAIETRKLDRIDSPQHHRGDYVQRHAVDASAQAATCTRCHQTQFCEGCHMARGVSGGAAGAINPHPIGWTGHDTASPNHHGRSARRDILLCASCHDQGPATNCIRCHRVGGPGGNPHPNGWQTSRSADDPMCGYCHAP